MVTEITKKKSFKQMCQENGINVDTAYGYRANHYKLTDEEVIEHYLKQGAKNDGRTGRFQMANLCREQGIDHKQYHGFCGGNAEEMKFFSPEDRLLLFRAMYKPLLGENPHRILSAYTIAKTDGKVFKKFKCLVCGEKGIGTLSTILQHIKRHTD